ncbi:aldehyde dehydrogenase family protein [Spongiactinospora sp. TRM90649]|uniref:aldehyde dehydrogenase family protein n=1 Tax=Spongiactinospora sp. TRM90649 TaxID=3031114 RepID=UPI0023F69F04|nr:aldehyde dehydrogenase family protein [Spongiactinospora sp. TRM90649]MDF5752251.1 aldehyde dehydrogenase family protein [Spongiactinospora sp. TRM90649]
MVAIGGPALSGDTFESFNPASGEIIAHFPVHSAAEVGAAVRRARAAAGAWAETGFTARGRVLRAWRAALVREARSLARLVHQENGKSYPDAMLELLVTAQHLTWAAKHARAVLGPRRAPSGILMANHSARVEYRPLGVIGVLGTWDYPVFGPIGTVGYALAAGNAAVLKPSEHTTATGLRLAATWREAGGDPALFQVVTGAAATGEALCRAGVDKIGFTGCPATAQKVARACADTLTPVLIDGGGSDAMLVDHDADLDAAADGAVWGAMSNAGQTCIAIERVYVHERVYDAFVAKVTAIAGRLSAGPGAPIGPMTMPAQAEIVRRHIADALDRGGRAVVGGPGAVGERYVQPTVLVDVPEDALVVREETFGPVLTVARVTDMDEGLRLADATRFGLGGAVYSRARGVELARRMRSGMTSVNSVLSFAGVPSLPYGGTADSGFGRIHGPDGLREWSRSKAVTRQRFPGPLRTTTFTRRPSDDRRIAGLLRLLYGRR